MVRYQELPPPPSPYTIFSSEVTPNLSPDLDGIEQRVAEEWAKLTAAQKARYEARARVLDREFKAAHPEFHLHRKSGMMRAPAPLMPKKPRRQSVAAQELDTNTSTDNEPHVGGSVPRPHPPKYMPYPAAPMTGPGNHLGVRQLRPRRVKKVRDEGT
ncbi:hypothetical protein DXG01_006446 [Tephrocybe rancida]|nr:hypothetical protein DXG01_006446 [Tephrocybe rancida]